MGEEAEDCRMMGAAVLAEANGQRIAAGLFRPRVQLPATVAAQQLGPVRALGQLQQIAAKRRTLALAILRAEFIHLAKPRLIHWKRKANGVEWMTCTIWSRT
jgi:hypothetical protein